VTGVYGSVTINSDGSYTYVIDESNTAVQALRINGQTLTDVFTYTVTDAGGLADTNQVTITIQGRNDNPVANADQGTAVEWGGVFNELVGSNAVGNVLDNDTDVDSDLSGEIKLVAGLVAGRASQASGHVGAVVVGEYGSITIMADGSYSYVTDENDVAVQALRLLGQTLTDVFTYTVTDAGGLTDTNQLTVTIRGRNDNPVANPDQGTAIEKGGAFNGTAGANAVGNVLDNDTDTDSASDGETKSVAGVVAGLVSEASGDIGESVTGVYGSITINSDGTYVYVIDESNVDVQGLRLISDTLTDVFTYTVVDAGGLVDTNQVTILLQGANDTPFEITPTGLTIDENSANGTLVGQLHMEDVDFGDVATYRLINDANGRFEIDAATGELRVKDGSQLDFEASATHQFVVRATDIGGLYIDRTFVVNLLNVNEKPIGTSDRYFTTYIDRINEGEPGVIRNDSDPEGDAMVARLVTAPAKGTIRFNPDGSFFYQPDGAYVGTLTFVYELSDGLLASDWVTVEIVIDLPKTLSGTTSSDSGSSSKETADANSNNSKTLAEGVGYATTIGALSTSSTNSSTAAVTSSADSAETQAAAVTVANIVGESIARTDTSNTVAEAEKTVQAVSFNGSLVSGAESTMEVQETRFEYASFAERFARSRSSDRARFIDEISNPNAKDRDSRRSETDTSIELNTTAVVQTVIGTGVVLWLAQGFQIAATVVTAAPVWTGLDPLAMTMGVDNKGDKRTPLSAEEKLFDK
jgi:VCBS repeat-containing protein